MAQYLMSQVQSHDLTIPGLTTSRSWHSNCRYEPYPMSAPSRIQYMTTAPTSSYTRPMHYANTQNGMDYTAYSTSNQSMSWARPSYGSYAMAYEDDTSSPYATQQPPSWMLPNPDPMTNATACYVNGQMPRSQQNGMWAEHMNASSLSQQTQQLLAPAYTVGGNDGTAGFQAANTLGSSMTANDRILPTPARNYTTTGVSTLESLPMSALSHRSSVGWQTETASNASQTSSRTSCSNGSDPSSQRLNPTCPSQDLTYGYMGMTTSTHTTVPASSLPIAVDNTQSPQQTQATPASTQNTQRCRTISRESLRSSPTANPIGYGYTSSAGARTSNLRHASGTLADGQSYTRAQPLANTAVEDYGQDYSACQSQSNRASISSGY